ncbi:MAG: tetratricopeptide repeat protein [Deltaproteobacteria bacterium]|nr:MAG: tetratricopeptide repeat protein [Deltaproteobacteria bacterium]
MDPKHALDEARRLIRSEGDARAEDIERLLGQAESEPALWREVHATRGQWHMESARYDEALTVAEKLHGSQIESARAVGHNLAGAVHLQRGDYALAFAEFEAALALYGERDAQAVARIENNLGLLCLRIRQLEGAVAHFGRAVAFFESASDALFAARVRANLGIALVDLGQRVEARQTLEHALVALASDPSWEANVQGSLADLCVDEARYAEAEAWLRKALVTRRRIGQRRQLAGGHLLLAKTLLAQDRDEEAWSHLATGLAMAEELGLRESIADGMELKAQALARRGEYREAYELHVEVASLRDDLRRDELQRRVLDAENRTILAEARKDAERRRLEAEELRVAKENAEASLRARSEFLATTSHELRGPLTAVLGACELLSYQVHDPRGRDLVGLALSSARLLQDVVGEVLELSRLDAGDFELVDGVIEVRALVEDTAAMASSGGEVPVQVHVDEGVPHAVAGDPSRLKQVLLNLVGNAVKYSERGAVAVRVTCADDELRISVRDHGPGIPESFVPLLFEPFARAQTAFVRARSGTGLGLSIASRLSRAMGGDVALESTGPEGSTFALWLPAREVRNEAPDEAPIEEAVGLTVLLVEDDAVVGQVLCSMIGVLGHRASHVASAEKAHATLLEDTPDVVISDHRLPGESGLDLAAKWADKLRFIVLSGEVSAELSDQAAAVGVEAVLSKPVGLAALGAALNG